MNGTEGFKGHLSQQAIVNLERHRFVIKPESMDGFKRLRSTFHTLQPKYPYLSGLGFFGSRTKGTEDGKSDYDTVAFYDSSKMTLGTGRSENWREIVSTFEQSLGGHLDHRIKPVLRGQGEGGLRINISEEQTNGDLDLFTSLSAPYIKRAINENVLEEVDHPPTRSIMSRFLLSVGDEVYANRKYILDQLDALANGDKYFQILMQLLGGFERGVGKVPTPLFDGLPQTIKEARSYFITK